MPQTHKYASENSGESAAFSAVFGKIPMAFCYVTFPDFLSFVMIL